MNNALKVIHFPNIISSSLVERFDMNESIDFIVVLLHLSS